MGERIDLQPVLDQLRRLQESLDTNAKELGEASLELRELRTDLAWIRAKVEKHGEVLAELEQRLTRLEERERGKEKADEKVEKVEATGRGWVQWVIATLIALLAMLPGLFALFRSK